MNKKNSFLQSYRFALEGIYFVIRKNRNMKIHLVIAAIVIIVGHNLEINPFETGIVTIMIVLVIIAEMLNTVVEETVNLITKDYKIEAKIAKDVSAGAVLVSAIAAAIVGIIVFLPKITFFLR